MPNKKTKQPDKTEISEISELSEKKKLRKKLIRSSGPDSQILSDSGEEIAESQKDLNQPIYDSEISEISDEKKPSRKPIRSSDTGGQKISGSKGQTAKTKKGLNQPNNNEDHEKQVSPIIQPLSDHEIQTSSEPLSNQKEKITKPAKNNQSKVQDYLMILIGFMLIVFAAMNLLKIDPFANRQEFQITPVVDQQGFAPIFIPKQAASEQIPVSVAAEPEIPRRLVIDKIDLDAPVTIAHSINVNIDDQEVTQFLVPEEFAAGWHEGSAPLGVAGNTVLSGHHNAYGEVFKDLVDLEVGDRVKVFSDDNVYDYIIANKMILSEKDEPLEVRIENGRWILHSDDERLTLVTCWPERTNTHRLILVAIPDPEMVRQRPPEKISEPTPSMETSSAIVDLPILTDASSSIDPIEDQYFEVINPESLSVNIRKNPDLESEIVGKLKKTDVAVGLGRTVDGDWIFIKMNGISGWVSADLVEIRIPTQLLPTLISTQISP